MKRIATTLAGMFSLVIFLIPEAHALNVIRATFSKGKVFVVGTGAKNIKTKGLTPRCSVIQNP